MGVLKQHYVGRHDDNLIQSFSEMTNAWGTVPNLKGDPKYSERGPKGDLILSKKGTKNGT